MQDYVKAFFSGLHNEYLKARGYKKVRHTFSRDLGSYTERIQFQGSAWNDSSGPWRFYINFGVEFHGRRAVSRGFPGTHCWTRIEHIVSGAPSEYDLLKTETAELAGKVADYLESASQHVRKHIAEIRKAYDSKVWPEFPEA